MSTDRQNIGTISPELNQEFQELEFQSKSIENILQTLHHWNTDIERMKAELWTEVFKELDIDPQQLNDITRFQLTPNGEIIKKED